MGNTQRFMKLFSGSQEAYLMNNGSRIWTKQSPPIEDVYIGHLKGEFRIGIMPIKSNGRCNFGAIDIDTTVDFIDICSKVKAKKLPLLCCRSKSGGAHLYTFIGGEGEKASSLKAKLSKWAVELGFTKHETYPKQDEVFGGQGNGIHIPYQNCQGAGTQVFAFSENGTPLEFEDFLNLAEQMKQSTNKFIDLNLPPSCIRGYLIDGETIEKGTQHNVLLQIMAFLNKKYLTISKEEFYIKVKEISDVACDPTPKEKDLKRLSNSYFTAKYHYSCNNCSTISDRCDRAECEQLKYGVNNKQIFVDDYIEKAPKTSKKEIKNAKIEAEIKNRITNLHKVNTSPLTYTLSVDGIKIHISSSELLSLAKFEEYLMANVGITLPYCTPQIWKNVLNSLFQNIEAEAPNLNYSEKEEFRHTLEEYLNEVPTVNDREEGLKKQSAFVIDDLETGFFLNKFRIWAIKNRMTYPKPHKASRLLVELGCKIEKMPRNGIDVLVMVYPKVFKKKVKKRHLTIM